MSLMRGVLLLGRFRSVAQLNAMSADDHRNTLIVELSNRTNQPVAHYQALGDAELEGRGATLVCLREAGIRTDAQLKTMSDDDRRNTLIAEIKGFNIFFDLNHLQAVSDLDLVLTLLGRTTSAAAPTIARSRSSGASCWLDDFVLTSS